MPSYSPPARSFFTPPLPPEYQNPFADKPTLRGTNSDSGIINAGTFTNRRPIPPPSLMPGHERIPFRPPELQPAEQNQQNQRPPDQPSIAIPKKALNTPSQKIYKIDYSQTVEHNLNNSEIVQNNGVLHFPSISRILSGSNGRKEDIPEVLLRTVTIRPIILSSSQPSIQSSSISNLNHKRFDDDLIDDEIIDEKSTELIDVVYSTEIDEIIDLTTPAPIQSSTSLIFSSVKSPTIQTWTIAWNIHVYLSAILFTVLAVYSIFKMIFYDKLTHLFNQSYFICIHLILILICLARIFYLCYDAYNIHSSFHIFISEILLNLPATFLTVSFAILILFLLIRSLNNKNNRYATLMRPLTIVIGSSVHIGLCITLHFVESYGDVQQQIYINTKTINLIKNHRPRVLSLICQIIYIFICLSLGLFYLYIYRILKRVLRNKSQNYIHGYQNLSYGIHITIATGLLFILLSILQVYGAVSISTIRPLIKTGSDIDWLQWGYQFSLRLIEISIIILISWVTGLKTGASKINLQREKVMEQHNISGFALFPCTSSSSQEHFETDYPAVCNANTNLHTYTLRTGKPIYDDNLALNSLGQQTNDFVQSYETTNSTRSSLHNSDRQQQPSDDVDIVQTDHYENPNFELHSVNQRTTDNCYSEPLNCQPIDEQQKIVKNFDFQNFERPNFDRPNSRNEFRASKNLKVLNNIERGNYENNSERRSSNSNHSYGSGRQFNNYNFNQNSFERHNNFVRKSGTLNNIGVIHGRINQTQQQQQPIPIIRQTGIQTLSSSRSTYDQRNTVGRSSKNKRASLERGFILPDDEYSPTNYDNSSSGGSDCIERSQQKKRSIIEPQQSSSGDSTTSGSMLVAEHGFVRFRALDDIGIIHNTNSNQIPLNRTTGRTVKEKRFTNT